jgi:hypothetical protein
MQFIVGSLMLYISLNVEKLLDDVSVIIISAQEIADFLSSQVTTLQNCL